MNWQDIPGWEGLYQASDEGHIQSVVRILERPTPRNQSRLSTQSYGGRVLSQKTRRNGYQEVNLWRDNKGSSCLVHRMVALAFLGDPQPEVNHKDGNKANNRISNLEWCSRSENRIHAYRVLGCIVPRSGKPARHFIEKLIELQA